MSRSTRIVRFRQLRACWCATTYVSRSKTPCSIIQKTSRSKTLLGISFPTPRAKMPNSNVAAMAARRNTRPRISILFSRELDVHHLVVLAGFGVVAGHFERLGIRSGSRIHLGHHLLLFREGAVKGVFPGERLAVGRQLA